MTPSDKCHDALDDPSGTSSILSVGNEPTLSASIGRSLSTLEGPDTKHKTPINAVLAPKLVKSGDDSVSLNEGDKCEIQTLYEGPPKCGCCKNWVEEYPDDLRMNIEQQTQTKEKALVVRMRKGHSDGKLLELDSIIVQSSSLKQTLSEIFDGYQGITTSLKKLVFKAPFNPFYYQWNRFTDILERQKKEQPADYSFSQLLYQVLNAELCGEMAEIRDHIEQGVITYRFLWALFEPGSVVFNLRDGKESFFIVTSHSYNDEKGYFGVSAKFIDWDGQEFGYNSQTFVICKFSGTENISELTVYPARFHSSQSVARAVAIERGRKFEELQGTHYKAYSGSAHLRCGRNQTIERNIKERIIVDAAAYFNKAGGPVKLDKLTETSITPSLDLFDDQHVGAPTGSAGGVLQVARYEHLIRDRKMKRRAGQRAGTESKKDIATGLDEEQLLLCHSKVKGYQLKTKLWGEFDVDSITDISWNDEAFSNLVLPSGYKDLVTSFVEAQATDTAAFDDIIEGKGLGIVMLLVGSPGTGKTLTAEAVADKARKPLYVLSAGELGTKAKDVETRLDEILRLAEKWEAVLLFDECDVFLQARSMSHLEHNEIVAVFLRVIEYYRGILILTTNRGHAIDEAFKSRIHLTLFYPDLDAVAREKIWRRCAIVGNTEISLSSHEFSNLSKLSMNGRQIRNIVKIAKILAGREKSELGMKHIRTVLEATQENHGGNSDMLGTSVSEE